MATRDVLRLTADQFLVLLKRFHLLDEELHLMRQLIHFKSGVSHPQFLSQHSSHYPLEVATRETLPPRDGDPLDFRRPRPFLFESVLEVAYLQACEVKQLFDNLTQCHATFGNYCVEAANGRRESPSENERHAAVLREYSRHLEKALSAFSSAQTYFIQRCEEISPSSFSFPRVVKRDNEKTISLVEDTYRAYKKTVDMFIGSVLMDSASPGTWRLETALSFEPLWSSHVLPGSFAHSSSRYALIGGAAVMLDLPRFIPNLAHEAAHLVLMDHHNGPRLRLQDFRASVRQALAEMHSSLERMLTRSTNVVVHFESAADAHISEILADIVAVFVAGPYYIQSLFQSLAMIQPQGDQITGDVPFLVRLALLLEVVDQGLSQRQDAVAPPSRSSSIVRAGMLTQQSGLPWRWLNTAHFRPYVAYIESRRRDQSFRYFELYLQTVRPALQSLVASILRILRSSPPLASCFFCFEEEAAGQAMNRAAVASRVYETLTKEAGLSDTSATGTRMGASVRRLGHHGRGPWSCRLPNQYNVLARAVVRSTTAGDAEASLLHAGVAHLVAASVAEECATRFPKTGNEFTADRLLMKPYELRLFHAMHRGAATLASKTQINPANTPHHTEPLIGADRSVVRCYTYTLHWNGATSRLKNGRAFHFRLPPSFIAGAESQGRLAKFVAFGDFDLLCLRSKCIDGIKEALGPEARLNRAPALIAADAWSCHASAPGEGAEIGADGHVAQSVQPSKTFETERPAGGLTRTAGLTGAVTPSMTPEECHHAFAQQRDFVDVSTDFLTCTPDLSHSQFVVMSQVRFARQPGHRATFGHGETVASLLHNLVQRFGQLPAAQEQAKPLRILLGYGWEDAVVLWSLPSLAAFDITIRSVFWGYFGANAVGPQDTNSAFIERLHTTVLVADNRFWRYCGIVDRYADLGAAPESDVRSPNSPLDDPPTSPLDQRVKAAATRITVSTAIKSQGRPLHLRDLATPPPGLDADYWTGRETSGGGDGADIWKHISIKAAPSSPTAKRDVTLPEYVRMKTFCTLVNHLPRSAARVVDRVVCELGQSVNGMSLCADFATGSTDLILDWRFSVDLTLEAAFHGIVAVCDLLIKEGVILACSTRWLVSADGPKL